MGQLGPDFYAWCDEKDRAEALAAAFVALVGAGDPKGTCQLWTPDCRGESVSPDVALAAIRAGSVPFHACLWLVLTSGRGVLFDLDYRGATRDAREALHAGPDCRRYLMDRRIQVAYRDGPGPVNAKRSGPDDLMEAPVEVEAAIWAMATQQDIEELLLRLCASSPNKVVTTGACTETEWNAPVETYATYHADGQVARDLALSWLHLHDGMRMFDAAGLSLDELRARVDAAPHASRVAVGDDELTREQVLAALSTPSGALLEALEASAVPDAEWCAAEPVALETVEARKRGASTYEVDVTGQEHVHWIEQHAPYHVRRLPNEGVMLSTQPHRILWPLWADALSLLGIRETP